MKHYTHPKWGKSIPFSLVIFLSLLTSGYAEENKTVRKEVYYLFTSINNQDSLQENLENLNGLKNTNDEYGHAAGDELIFGAAECLSKAFEGIGNVYRMGGDEFEILSTDHDVDFDSAIANLKHICENWHGTYVKELTMSIGLASGENVNRQFFAEFVRTADERMYEDKRLFYQQSGRNRRK